MIPGIWLHLLGMWIHLKDFVKGDSEKCILYIKVKLRYSHRETTFVGRDLNLIRKIRSLKLVKRIKDSF